MSLITNEDITQSVADALQFISYYHPKDYISAISEAWQREQAAAAKDALAQILINSRLCAEGHRPICQDTGMVVVFAKVGMNARFEGDRSLQELINAGVRQAYTHPDNVLRASMVNPPIGARQNTRDNTPAIVHTELVSGEGLELQLAAKGGGSENKSRFAILNPSDDLVDWVVKTVPGMGAGWCPPGMLGIGIGGSAEKAMLMAKQSLMEAVDIQQIVAQGPKNDTEALRLEIYNKVNALGIGAQGLGGLTTIVDVKIHQYPTHAASLPVAMIPNCAATRHVHVHLDGSGPAHLTPPSLSDWPKLDWDPSVGSTQVDLDHLSKADVQQWQPGQRLLLNGKILTGRDAAHKKLKELLDKGQPLPAGVDLKNRMIYYVGPVDPIGDEAVGPAGPTTSTRMDKFTDQMLEQTGLIGMIGKAERGPQAIEAIKQHQAVYLMAVGGAAYLVSQAIKSAKVVAFAELGMEAIYEFEVENMPVTVAVDSQGNSVHQSGPKHWQLEIEQQGLWR